MKYLLLILLIPTITQAQQKGSTKIMAKADTAGLFNKVALYLFDRGCTFETKDYALGVISTGALSSKKYSTSVKLRIRFTDSSFTVTGYIVSDIELFGVKSGDIQVSFSGAKKSPMRDAWNEMDELAKKFSTQITYAQ